MKKLIVGVAAALSLWTTNAAADGPYRRPPPTIAAPVYAPPPVPTWTGFYLGAGVGAGAVVHEFSVHDRSFDPPERILHFDGIGGEGVLGTVIVGWDWQVGATTVFGLFADYDFSDISTRHRVFDDMLRQSIDHNNTWSIGARLGWLSSPSTLWYLTGGYTQAQFDHSARFLDLDDLTVSRDRTLDGYFVGAGVDARLATSNWFLRLEYRFSEFDGGGINVGDDEFRVTSEPSMHTARLTLTYKLGGGYGWGWGNWGQ